MKIIATLLFITTLSVLSACNQNSTATDSIQQDETPLDQVALRSIQSCEALKQKFVGNWVENLLSNERYGIDGIQTLPVGLGVEDTLSASTGAAATDTGSTPDDVSQTNIQEEGVDEADSVKADSLGNLYIAQHDKLVIADAFPPQSMNIISTLDLGGFVSGIYLSEQDQLLIALVTPLIQPNQLPQVDALVAPYIWSNPKTDVVIIDISDPSQPNITRKVRLDGNLVSSRRIESRLHLVQAYYLNPFIYAQDSDIRTQLQGFHQAFIDNNIELMDDIKSRITQLVLDKLDVDQAQTLLPQLQVFIGDTIQQSGQLACEDVYSPDIDLQQNQLLTVTSMDISGNNIDRVGAIGSGWITYASSQDLFVIQPGFHWWWNNDQLQQSAIHHFSISGLKPEYRSSGIVKGYVNNSFSLSYFNDHLRVATTQNLWNRPDRSDIRSTNHLFVLADNASNGMDIIGSVENYADNERIFSARFLGDKGFVVTFRQVDPLFSFDLSDPANPAIAGELKIPGFSNYMHPVGDNHLLTIGRDGTDTGITNQIAIKLFDISNLATPMLVDTYTPDINNGYSWSQANWDPHAFTYYAPQQVLAVPVASYNSLSDDYFAGIIALNVDTRQGLTLAGRVDHEDLLQNADCDVASGLCNSNYFGWLAQPNRSIFMTENTNTYLYSLSNIGVKAVNTTDFNVTTGSLLLPASEQFYGLYY